MLRQKKRWRTDAVAAILDDDAQTEDVRHLRAGREVRRQDVCILQGELVCACVCVCVHATRPCVCVCVCVCVCARVLFLSLHDRN